MSAWGPVTLSPRKYCVTIRTSCHPFDCVMHGAVPSRLYSTNGRRNAALRHQWSCNLCKVKTVADRSAKSSRLTHTNIKVKSLPTP